MDRPLKRWRSQESPLGIARRRVLGKEAIDNHAQALQTAQDRIPGRAYVSFEDLAPDERHGDRDQPEEDKIDLLHPPARPQTERAHRLLPGIVVGSGRT